MHQPRPTPPPPPAPPADRYVRDDSGVALIVGAFAVVVFIVVALELLP